MGKVIVREGGLVVHGLDKHPDDVTIQNYQIFNNFYICDPRDLNINVKNQKG